MSIWKTVLRQLRNANINRNSTGTVPTWCICNEITSRHERSVAESFCDVLLGVAVMRQRFGFGKSDVCRRLWCITCFLCALECYYVSHSEYKMRCQYGVLLWVTGRMFIVVSVREFGWFSHSNTTTQLTHSTCVWFLYLATCFDSSASHH